MQRSDFDQLLEIIESIPSINREIGFGEEQGYWWLKLSVDISHELAWHVVHGLGHVINYLSEEKRLPTRFYPVAPSLEYGGPEEFLAWVIEVEHPDFLPNNLSEWLRSRLPSPIEDYGRWKNS